MKRILIGGLATLFVCMLAPCAQGVMYAEKKSSVETREKNLTPQQQASITLLPKVLSGQPIKVNIEAPFDGGKHYCEGFKQRVQNAYNAWFQNAVRTIKEQGRQREFADMQRVLQNGVNVQPTCVEAGSPAPAADLTVSFEKSVSNVQKICGEHTTGCQQDGIPGKQPMKVITPAFPDMYDNGKQMIYLDSTKMNNVLVHELGHTLGVADAYKEGAAKNASQTHRSKQQTPDTVMNSGGINPLTPDDADGLINIIDAWNMSDMKKKHPWNWRKYVSPRVRDGWNSLDRDKKTKKPLDRYGLGTSKQVEFENRIKNMELKAL